MNEHRRGNGIRAYHSCIILLFLIMALTPSAVAAVIGGNQGWYKVYCNVDGANVYFDNTYEGVITSGVLSVPVYTTGIAFKTYTVSMPGYTTWEKPVPGVPGNGVTIQLYATLNPVQPTVAPVIGGSQGWYQVNCNVNGAQVTFDNQVVGTIVNGVLTVPVYTTGTPYKTYTVSMPGYVSYTAPITNFPASGETIQLYATLNPQLSTATPTSAPTSVPTIPPTVPPTPVIVVQPTEVPTPVPTQIGLEIIPQATVPIATSTPQVTPASSIANPASVYCGKVGGTTVIVKNPDGNEYGMCTFTNGTSCEEWTLFRGEGCKAGVAAPATITPAAVGSADNNQYAVGQVPSTQITTLTAVSTPKIQSTPPSSSPSNSGDSNLTLPIIVILAILLLAGGGYAIYRMREKPSGDQTPKKITTIAPQPSPTGSTIKPELTLTLDHNQLTADDWDRMTIQLENRGNAHAKDVRLTFSDEFETKWIKPATINAGETTSLDIGIRPKLKGKIPLEVTVMYCDGTGKEYRETHEFWIDVVDRMSISPVSSFTPKPLTPRQPPAELSDRYTDWEFIGKGGFARVFKAKRKDGKYVAVKIPISLDASTGRSFIAEMQNWTKIDHPNIVRVFDYNIMPMPYFEMELCDGSLAEKEKPIESEEAAWILFNVCEGLKFTHARKIIHRDLKPQNILLKNSVPKISDWGLSRVITESTSTTAASFTPYYAAPEQINNNQKDERTDIWQLGVIFYELVTGHLPFTGDSMVAVMAAIATKNSQPPSAINPSSYDVEAMIMKCLEKNPSKRYQSVLELQKDLALYLRITYTESLKLSVTAKDYNRSAYYCGDLVMVNLSTGDMKSAYKYLLDFVHYSQGDVKVEAQGLSEQLKMRMEEGITEIPDELITKAEIIVHQVSVGFRKKG